MLQIWLKLIDFKILILLIISFKKFASSNLKVYAFGKILSEKE
jgi:hypothetical protein